MQALQKHKNQAEMVESIGIQEIVIQADIQVTAAIIMVLKDTNVAP